MFPFLPESILLDPEQQLDIYTFITFQQFPQPQKRWDLAQKTRVYAFQCP
jgi:hypothetical protein